MKSFKEFAQELFLSISKQSASTLIELCPTNDSLPNATAFLIEKYCTYLEGIKKSIQDSLPSYDDSLEKLKKQLEEFKKLTPEEQANTVLAELTYSKDLLTKCSEDAEKNIQVATKIREATKDSNSKDLLKEAETQIAQIAELEIQTSTIQLKHYQEQLKLISANEEDSKSIKVIVEKKINYLQSEVDKLTLQKLSTKKTLSDIADTIAKLSLKS
jgi:hypothetical protein